MTRWLALLLALVLAYAPSADAWSGYDPHQRADFRKTHPCPVTGKTTGACHGYVVDHVIPLCAAGPDLASNMQWQKRRASLAKDRREARYCACIRTKGKDACVFKP